MSDEILSDRSVCEIIPAKEDRELPEDESYWSQVNQDMVKELQREADSPFTNYLFQLFSMYVEFNSDKPGKLYGYVEADGSDSGYVSLFQCGRDNSQPIRNKGLVPLTDPTVLSATTNVKICSQLYILIEDDEEEEEEGDGEEEDGDEDEEEEVDVNFDEERQVFNKRIVWNLSTPGVRFFDCCLSRVSRCKFGYGRVYYVLSKRAVEATMEVSFTTPDDSDAPRGRNVGGKIVAYYGNFDFDCSPDDIDYYKLTLFETESLAFLPNGKIPLLRSLLAVPYKCSLIIEAHLWDDSGDEIFNGFREFPVKLKDSNNDRIEGKRGCCLDLKVDWKCEGAANLADDVVL